MADWQSVELIGKTGALPDVARQRLIATLGGGPELQNLTYDDLLSRFVMAAGGTGQDVVQRMMSRWPGLAFDKVPFQASGEPLQIGGTPPGGTAGQPYTFTAGVTGGVGTRSFSISAGTLAGSGLTLNPTTGQISGSTPVAGIYAITIRVTDGSGLVLFLPVVITILV